ncbi:MAG: YjfI family protein [Candidatus Thiodiazotropha sp. (ex Lucinoma annulata)]|nr:YjfI family protein [Candidatus Thiodiazotropha sp. (ex Lucinoma borealis)]MCU7840684.1 YjfI family protein [Candidatus Thiodiazotropha sp. (ex Troendleina suluensis)]MCU7885291.1 YjfI family protein [Candidatus Thiodiazotropha sp. (ex Lucinoma annulata)]MCU7854685.1 YjfI family protein [Candidatus Thiodiazotropha sp. (ex Lucinoma borealis)]MCU7866322.1 YjfI family protein [Candidatus Thiodiazotropha sp. (ex Lucinoma borealis)]
MNNLLEKLERVLGMSDTGSLNGLEYEFNPIPGEVEVVQVAFKDREELPIYLTQSDSQMLCICYLWDDEEVISDKRAEMLEVMLDMNIPMPLSSFGRIGSRYTIFGALSLESSAESIARELTVLSDNALDAIDAMSEYLN